MPFDPIHPTSQELIAIAISELLPQRRPVLMVSRLVGYSDSTVATETDIPATGPFVCDGILTTAGIIEAVAQTCAARIGYVNKYILHRPVQIGFLAAVKDMKVAAHPPVGSTISTTVHVEAELMGMMLAEATVEMAGHVVATTEVKLAVK